LGQLVDDDGMVHGDAGRFGRNGQLLFLDPDVERLDGGLTSDGRLMNDVHE